MNPLHEYFLNNPGRLIHKWEHYFDIYHRHFQRFRGTKVTMLEIGVQNGGSLQMWKKYFGPLARIVGIDCDSRCKSLEEEQIEIYIGRQEDAEFLKTVCRTCGEIAIIVDDGGHTMSQMQTSFDTLYSYVSEGGVYLVEDMHTCYWKEYDGGFMAQGSFIEYTKKLIDQLNAYHSRDILSAGPRGFAEQTSAICFSDSVVVMEKLRAGPPRHAKTGQGGLEGMGGV